jgi:hypothetical protein
MAAKRSLSLPVIDHQSLKAVPHVETVSNEKRRPVWSASLRKEMNYLTASAPPRAESMFRERDEMIESQAA